jgi:hypothetical protein
MATNIAVFGLYKTRTNLEAAVDSLRAAGYRNSDISVLLPESTGSHDLAHEVHSKAPEGAASGAGAGALAGGVLGWLAGIGALAIPGIGPFVAAGPIVTALAGAGAAGVTGGLIGGLMGFGLPEIEAKRYEGKIRGGHILLSVHADNREWARRAEEILTQTGAEDIARTGEAAADYQRP